MRRPGVATTTSTRLNLRLFADAAEYGGAADVMTATEHAECFVDLCGELAGRGDDENARGAAVLRRLREAFYDW